MEEILKKYEARVAEANKKLQKAKDNLNRERCKKREGIKKFLNSLNDLKQSNIYKITPEGRIYNKMTFKELTSSPYCSIKTPDGRKGYSRIKLTATNLVKNPKKYDKIVCLDSDDTNYHPSNLEWAPTLYGECIFNKKTDKKIRNKIRVLYNHCYNEKSPDYKDYGKKGIKICKQWREDSISFLRWAKESGYEKGNWLYRYDKEGNYTPENCYWGKPFKLKLNCEMIAAIKEDDINTRKQIADKYQISYERVRQVKNDIKTKTCK